MSKIEKFKDLIAWQKSRIISKNIYSVTNSENFKKDFCLKNQIRRASISVMLNLAEGFAKQSNREFIKYLFQSHGSLVEIQSALYISLDRKYITKDDFEELYAKCNETSRIISGLIKYLKNS